MNAILDNIFPAYAHVDGLHSDIAAGKQLSAAQLETIRTPTLIVSARDDRYGTNASAQYTASRIAEQSSLISTKAGTLGLGMAPK